jgi:hypothetical protein
LHYNPVLTFASIMDFSQPTLSFLNRCTRTVLISGFHRGVNVALALLGCYAKSIVS